ncbi:MAG TPA: hypothetical protein VKN64_00175 [Halanaerobiales bacterium]|nr:hypothetical protein [Halanaerobiales bacterium]
MAKSLKQIIKNFYNNMVNTTDTGQDLEEKIEKENRSFIKEIVDFFIEKFNFLKPKNKE